MSYFVGIMFKYKLSRLRKTERADLFSYKKKLVICCSSCLFVFLFFFLFVRTCVRACVCVCVCVCMCVLLVVFLFKGFSSFSCCLGYVVSLKCGAIESK